MLAVVHSLLCRAPCWCFGDRSFVCSTLVAFCSSFVVNCCFLSVEVFFCSVAVCWRGLLIVVCFVLSSV